MLAVDPNQLQVSINQTKVRETADNKPFTEYILKLQYGQKKWQVTRRYKNFCELHQSLLGNFPGVRLPDSSNAIINTSDINALFQGKRPTIIEDRRKALQQYLRELAKMDVIRNSKFYKQFVEFEDAPACSSRASVTSTDTQHSHPRAPLKEKAVNQPKAGPQSPSSFLKCWNEKQRMNAY